MIDGKKVGQAIRDADSQVPANKCLNTGGNIGLTFIAASISELAESVGRLADAVVQASTEGPDLEAGHSGSEGLPVCMRIECPDCMWLKCTRETGICNNVKLF